MSLDRFSKHLPFDMYDGRGEQIQLAGKDCLYFLECVSQWEFEKGEESSFSYPHWMVLVGPKGPNGIFRVERHRVMGTIALCSINVDGRHSYLEELQEPVNRNHFLTLVSNILADQI